MTRAVHAACQLRKMSRRDRCALCAWEMRFAARPELATYLLLAALAAVIAVVPYNLGVSPMILCAPLSLYVVARHEPYRWGTAALLLGVAGTFVSPLHRLPGGLPTRWPSNTPNAPAGSRPRTRKSSTRWAGSSTCAANRPPPCRC